MDFRFYMPVHVCSGENILQKEGYRMRALGDSCLIVTGKSSAQMSGALQDMESALNTAGIRFCIYDGIGQNPLVSSCREAARMAADQQAKFIVGIGGGSPLDAAKAVAVLAQNPEMEKETLFGMPWQKNPELQWQQDTLPIVLVGTTSGTGSEVSSVSVLTTDYGLKRSISAPCLYASIAYADAKYTESMPLEVTKSTALDAFSHAAEGFLSPKCGDVAAVCARQALPVLWENLTWMDQGGAIDKLRHHQLYYASLWAGLVLNALGTSFPHPYGYILTEDFDIPHGRACTTFFPALLSYTLKTQPSRAQELLELLGDDFHTVSGRLTRLSDTSHIRMTEEQIDQYVAGRFRGLKHYANVFGGFNEEKGRCIFQNLFLRD